MDFGGNGVISGPRLPKKNSRSKRDYEALQPFHFILQKPHLSFNLTSSIFVPAKKPSKLNPPALLESGKRLARGQKTAISAARVDALHLAVAALAEADYLLTWNCRHLANAQILRRLEREAAVRGWILPKVCTPLELMGDYPYESEDAADS